MGNAFRRVQMPAERRGILGQGSILMQTSVADRTSPVLRGKWIMEVLLGSPPPPPPPNVPVLRSDRGGSWMAVCSRPVSGWSSIARIPRATRAIAFIDPPGLALENFDVTGRWRLKDNGMPDFVRRVQLYDGSALDGPAGLRTALLKHADLVVLSFTEQLMTYALGRRVEHYDMPTVRAIARDAARHDNRLSAFILGMVKSAAFQMSTAPPSTADAVAECRTHTTERGNRDMYLTGKHLHRRTMLKGIGVSLSLPLLEAMVPAGTAGQNGGRKIRLACLEMVHGSAGTCAVGAKQHLWTPPIVGRGFDLAPSSLSPLEPWRDFVTIVSNTDVRMAEAFELQEVGADHFRSSAVFLTQAHPRQTMGSDVRVGASLDQHYAKRFGQDTPVPSMQLCIENIDQAGGCSYGYSCVYTDTLSWAEAERAATDGARPARGIRSVVRCGRNEGAARRAPARGPQHSRRDQWGSRATEDRALARTIARS